MTYQSVTTYDGKILKSFEELTDKQIETAVSTVAPFDRRLRARSWTVDGAPW